MKECCDQIHKDDGREDDGRKGDWGKHKNDDKELDWDNYTGFPDPSFGIKEDDDTQT